MSARRGAASSSPSSGATSGISEVDDAVRAAAAAEDPQAIAFVDGWLQGYDQAVAEVSALLHLREKPPQVAGIPRDSTLTRVVRLLVRVLSGRG